MYMLTPELKAQITQQGMSPDLAEEQIQNFENGFPPLQIHAPATIEDGIQLLDDASLKKCLEAYEKYSPSKDIVKFVPASGAASRMFKDLFAFLDRGKVELPVEPFVATFVNSLKKFAFYEDLDAGLRSRGTSIEEALAEQNYALIIHFLLDDVGLEYGSLPKGLLKFHSYAEGNRTPVEEHFVEGAAYAVGKGNAVRLHFTVSPEHQQKFEHHVAEVLPKMEAKFGVSFSVTFSQQKKSTDTIAVDMENRPFLDDDGSILFRPAGHGALLENLNELDADLIFIKNIDNVVPDRIKNPTNTYKKAIGGILVDAQNAVFEALSRLDAEITEENIRHAEEVYSNKLGAKFPESYSDLSLQEKANHLHHKLNRPIRVCGMVENTGEPGGGPFWVKESDGSLSLQIGETAQLDLSDPVQKSLFDQSTHFNPTDLVCGVRNYKGNKFNLMDYRDPKTGFITEKSKSGRSLKAQELPGLWNGSMAHWNSIFVEVPLITFNPVKTINDLLREVHQ